jgi:hypothetical protein
MASGLVIMLYQLEVTAVTSLQETEGQRLWALQRQLVSIVFITYALREAA